MTSLSEQIQSIANRYRIAELYVFGSRATEIAERVRDLIELEDLLDVNRVDLVVLPEANPFLAVDIIRGELLFCSDLDAQAEHELYILRRAGDLAHYERERWRQVILGEAP